VKTTLYDLLELSRTASQEAILSSYQRLSAKVSDSDPDAENKRKILTEAFSSLSEPARRLRYDKKLSDESTSPEISVYDENSTSPFKKILFTGLVIALCAFGYNKYSKDKEAAFIEKERARTAEVLAAAQRAEQEELLAAKMNRDEQLRQDRQQRYEAEVARQQGAQISQSITYAEERARRESESQARMQQREQENAQRKEQTEAQNRLARDKAQLRQLESENSRYRRFSVN
jgi:colicin import membrane protein